MDRPASPQGVGRGVLLDDGPSPYNADMTVRRASLHTLGCRVNHAETSILGEGLRRKGYQLVEVGQPVDLFVLNTCAVTEDAERTSRYLIRKTLRHSPHAYIAVTGCYAQTGVEALKRQSGIDLIVGHQFKLALPDYVPAGENLCKRTAPEVRHTNTMSREEFDHPFYGEADSTRAPLKIQDGCGDMCSFCIIPFARGRARSRAIDDILREADSLAERGHREIVLTGVNIGQYACRGTDICGLLERLEPIPGIERIRISSIEPTTVSERLLDLMATSRKLCPFLHIPLQSGDDRILYAMNRRHTVRDFTVLVERALSLVPSLGLGTDVMVGFPGETDEQFANTVALVADLPFSYLHAFAYSPRPGTAATKLPERVAPAVVTKRSAMLQRLCRAKRLAFHQRSIGRTVQVLFEEGTHDGYRCGTTDNFTRVAVAAENDLANRMAAVTVTAATDRWAIGRLAARPAGGISMVCQ